jgi:RNA polymerase sigma-70 factor, ECF subfamily
VKSVVFLLLLHFDQHHAHHMAEEVVSGIRCQNKLYSPVTLSHRAALYIQTGMKQSMIHPMKKDDTALFASASKDVSQADFEALFGRYWAHVYRVVRRLVSDPAEAEDLTLETFVRLYQRLPIQDADFQLGGWLYRVAANLGLQSIRAFKRREGYELRAGEFALEETHTEHPEKTVIQNEEEALARQALAQMNERSAQLLIMKYSGLSYKEIASTLNLAPSSIGTLLLRAEREFETCYRALAQEEA